MNALAAAPELVGSIVLVTDVRVTTPRCRACADCADCAGYVGAVIESNGGRCMA